MTEADEQDCFGACGVKGAIPRRIQTPFGRATIYVCGDCWVTMTSTDKLAYAVGELRARGKLLAATPEDKALASPTYGPYKVGFNVDGWVDLHTLGDVEVATFRGHNAKDTARYFRDLENRVVAATIERDEARRFAEKLLAKRCSVCDTPAGCLGPDLSGVKQVAVDSLPAKEMEGRFNVKARVVRAPWKEKEDLFSRWAPIIEQMGWDSPKKGKTRKPRGACPATISHGPGHQSTSGCDKTMEHKQHHADAAGQHLYWSQKKGMTGFFDESPEEKKE